MPDRILTLIIVACVLGFLVVAFILCCCAFASGKQHQTEKVEDEEQEKALACMKE